MMSYIWGRGSELWIMVITYFMNILTILVNILTKFEHDSWTKTTNNPTPWAKKIRKPSVQENTQQNIY